MSRFIIGFAIVLPYIWLDLDVIGAIHCRKATEEEVNLFAAEGDVAGQAQFQLSSFASAEVQNDGMLIVLEKD